MALLSDAIRYGTRAAQPAATAVAIGTLYYVSDETLMERSNGTTWQQVADNSGGGGGTGDVPMIGQTSIAWMPAFTSGGTYQLMGLGDNPSNSGSGGITRVSTANNVYVDAATAAAATSQAHFSSQTMTYVERRHNPIVDITVRAPSTLTSVRIWVGLFSTTTSIDADTSPGHCAAFRFSSVAGDTGWRPCTRDGATQTTATAIGTVVADTEYHLKIRCVITGTPTVYFSVNGGTETAQTANLPTSTQALGLTARVIAQAASARNISVARMLMTHGIAI